MDRKKKLLFNSTSSLLFQFTAIVSGFILPRLILSFYGSDVNGLVNSINQFLAVITFLELGVGSVVQSSLYKPLAENDNSSVSKIIVSASKFFNKLAIILSVYVTLLIILYPLIVAKDFDFVFTATLIGAIAISSFAQYYFGVVDRLLLSADQRGYIHYIAQTATLILNTVACAIIIKIGASIQLVKLVTSLIYLVRPLFLRIYVNKHYSLDRRITLTSEPIKQKWNGVAQHVSSVVLDNTDTIVLTVFSTLSNVSIYSVHHLVVYGVKTLFTSMTTGVQALLGELWAKKEIDELNKTFEWTEWAIHTGVTIIFGCTASLIVPFIQVYTLGITDTNYTVPTFALLITLANALHCLRLPYNIMILAGGHYKQTQNNYIIAAIMNIAISIITVKMWGLIGVAIGTLAAMIFQTVWMAVYVSKNFVNRSLFGFIKHCLVDTTIFIIAFYVSSLIKIKSLDYFSWGLLAIEKSLIWLLITFFSNIIVYKSFVLLLIKKLFHIEKNK